MEHRRNPRIDLDVDTLRSLLRLAFPDASLDSAVVMATGAINTVYKLVFNNARRSVALRIYQRDVDACAREVNLFEMLGGAIPIPAVRYAEPEPRSLHHPFLIADWVDGITVEDALAAEPAGTFELGGRVGEVLAAIGSFSFEAGGRLNRDLSVTPWAKVFGVENEHADHVSFTVALMRTYLDRHAGSHLCEADSQRLLQTTIRLGHLLPCEPIPPRLVHGDFNLSNIIVSRDAPFRVNGIIDWEWSHAGNPYCDIANLFRERGLISEDFTAGFVQSFVRAGGSLAREWRALAMLSDLISLLEMIDVDVRLNGRGQQALKALKHSLDVLETVSA